MKRLLIFIAIPLCFAAPALSAIADAHARMLPDEQQAMVLNQECSTSIKVVTRTSYEINVVSTVYRHRTHAAPTPNAHLEGTESTVVFGVEGTGCDMKACSICRMLNNCSDEEENCTGCDLAYYCNECPAAHKTSKFEVEGISIKKTCSLGQGISAPCDEVEEAIADRHKAFNVEV